MRRIVDDTTRKQLDGLRKWLPRVNAVDRSNFCDRAIAFLEDQRANAQYALRADPRRGETIYYVGLRRMAFERANGQCEVAGCCNPATDLHHPCGPACRCRGVLELELRHIVILCTPHHLEETERERTERWERAYE